MRTNVNIADDARQFAEVYAHANGLTSATPLPT